MWRKVGMSVVPKGLLGLVLWLVTGFAVIEFTTLALSACFQSESHAIVSDSQTLASAREP
jgi:hypothetical protein